MIVEKKELLTNSTLVREPSKEEFRDEHSTLITQKVEISNFTSPNLIEEGEKSIAQGSL